MRVARSPSISRQNDTVATQYASRLGLIAFTTAALNGLFSGADFSGAIQTALVTLGVFYVLGLVIGETARRIVEENVKTERTRQVGSTSGPGASAQRA